MSVASAGIGTRTVRGIAWAYGSYVGGRFLVLVSTAILARLLTPGDFGLVSLALVFMTFLDTVKDLGLTQALIVAGPDEEEARARTVFFWTVVIGAGLALVCTGLAPAAASFFDQPRLTAILAALALNFFLQALGATHYELARKHLDYRARTAAEIAELAVRGVVGIGLAIAGLGVWSLVIGYLAGTVARNIAVFALVPFRPSLRPSNEHLRDLLTFGGVLTLVDIGAAIVLNLDYIFVGRVLGATALGLYAIGYRLPQLLIMNLAVVAGNVLFPAYAAIDPARLREAFLISLRYTALLVLPMATGLALLARPVILALFGPKWEPAIPAMQVLSAYAVATVINIPAGTVYKVTRRSFILVALTIPDAIALFVALWHFADRGIVAVATCMLVVQAAFSAISFVLASHLLDVPLRATLGTLVGPAIAALGVALVTAPIARYVSSPWPAVLAGVVAGTAVYGALLWLVARDEMMRLRDMAFPRRVPGEVATGP